MTSELTIQELESYRDAIVGEDYNAPKLLPIRITEQIIATMQREAKLRNVLVYVTDMAETYIRHIGGVKHPQQSEYLREARMLANTSEYSGVEVKDAEPEA